MRNIFVLILLVAILCLKSKAQIVVNGKSTYRPYYSNAKTAISISYGSLFWNDSKQKDLVGYSESLEVFHDDFFTTGLRRFNYNASLRFGFEKGFTDKFSLKNYLVAGKLYTGVGFRPDLISVDKSNIIQLSTYANLILSQSHKKFKISYMLGPEFMLVNKNVIISDYIENPNDTPDDYNQKETIFEVGIATGLGFSYDFSTHFALFTDGVIGLSLPGGGLKITNSGFGLKYNF